jgi:hypothetical protein
MENQWENKTKEWECTMRVNMQRPHPENVTSKVQGSKGVFPNAVHIRTFKTCSLLFLRNSSTWMPVCRLHIYVLDFGVLTMVTMKNIFWDVTPCNMVEVYRCFDGKYCLHLYGRSLSKGRNKQSTLCSLCSLLFWPILRHWIWRQYSSSTTSVNY